MRPGDKLSLQYNLSSAEEVGGVFSTGRVYLQQWVLGSLKMSPFEALYRRKCNTPMRSNDPPNRLHIALDMIKEMEQ